MIDIYYIKNNYKTLFKHLEKMDISDVQNYIPLYSLFFELNDSNFNSINLNHKYMINDIHEKKTENIYNITISQKVKENIDKKSVDAFFKFSPLLDPIKYMVGKYAKKNEKKDDTLHQGNEMLNLETDNTMPDNLKYLPKINTNNHKKILDNNNSAYVDSFFYYLSSKVLENHNFIHGNDFYGSFLGIKKQFNYNIIDDVDYLMESDYFEKNNEHLFLAQNLTEFMEYIYI